MTSTLHQKLKFVKNNKLVVIGGEKALLVIHLSSFSYIDAEDEVGTLFQALSIVEPSRKGLFSFVSYNDANLAIEHGATVEKSKPFAFLAPMPLQHAYILVKTLIAIYLMCTRSSPS